MQTGRDNPETSRVSIQLVCKKLHIHRVALLNVEKFEHKTREQDYVSININARNSKTIKTTITDGLLKSNFAVAAMSDT